MIPKNSINDKTPKTINEKSKKKIDLIIRKLKLNNKADVRILFLRFLNFI